MFGTIDKSKGLLFVTHDLDYSIRATMRKMQQEIEGLDENRLLNTPPEDLKCYMVERHGITPITLLRDQWYADYQDAPVDVRHDPMRWIDDRSRAVMVAGERVEVRIPFEGESELFYAKANTFSLNPPRAVIEKNEIVLRYETPADQPRDIRTLVDQTLKEIEQHLGWQRPMIDAHNQSLPDLLLPTLLSAAIAEFDFADIDRSMWSRAMDLLALRDPDPNVRVEACIQLASIGRAEVIPELFSKGNDPSEKVRHAALHAIVRLDRQYALGNVDRFCRLLEGRDASGYRWIFDPLTDEEWNGLDHGVKIAWQGYGPEQLVDPDEQWDEATQALWESGFYGLDADGDDDHQDHWDDVFFERVEAGFGNTNEDLAEINELLRLLTPEEPFSGFSDK